GSRFFSGRRLLRRRRARRRGRRGRGHTRDRRRRGRRDGRGRHRFRFSEHGGLGRGLIRQFEHVRNRNGDDDAEHDHDENRTEPQRRKNRAPSFVLEALVVVLLIVSGTLRIRHAPHLSIDVGVSILSYRVLAKTRSPMRASATSLVSWVSIMRATWPTRGAERPKSAA